MKQIRDILNNHQYTLKSYDDTLDKAFLGCYQSDLLSRVIQQSKPDMILITIINHINTVATATMCDLSAIILCEGQHPTQSMMDRANQEGIALITTSKKSHEVIIDLYDRGLI